MLRSRGWWGRRRVRGWGWGCTPGLAEAQAGMAGRRDLFRPDPGRRVRYDVLFGHFKRLQAAGCAFGGGAGVGMIARYGTAFAALAVFAVFAGAADHFLALGNLLGIVRQISYIAILGIGFSLALTAAELDLSFANVASLAGVVTGALVQSGAAGVAGLCGGVGDGGWVWGGEWVGGHGAEGAVFDCDFGDGVDCEWVGVCGDGWGGDHGTVAARVHGFGAGGAVGRAGAGVVDAGAVAVLALVFLKQTRPGVHLVATGEAAEAAALAGIKVRRMKVLGLGLSGCGGGAGGGAADGEFELGGADGGGGFPADGAGRGDVGDDDVRAGASERPGHAGGGVDDRCAVQWLGAVGGGLLRAGYLFGCHHHRVCQPVGQRAEAGGVQCLGKGSSCVVPLLCCWGCCWRARCWPGR